MLSVCGSIYQNENLLRFVRSILDKASDPDNIEFSVVEDEAGSEVMLDCFDQIYSMTKNLKVVQVTKEERVDYFEQCILFYERESIFPPDRISELYRRLRWYISGKLSRVWFPPARNYDLSIKYSSGDVILNTPLDLIVNFDLSEAYRKFKEKLAPGKNLSILFGLEQGNIVRHHGTRLFNRDLFDLLKKNDPRYSPTFFSFDERWFANAFFDDDWNTRAEKAGAVSRGWEEIFGERRFLTMIDSPWLPEYLSDNMIEDFPYFAKCIQEYKSRHNE
jgi:hypothetical protein